MSEKTGRRRRYKLKPDRDFQDFAKKLKAQRLALLEGVCSDYRKDKQAFLALQQQQVEDLFALEVEFRATLNALPNSTEIYRAFIDLIRDDVGNILQARPFFRELQTTFNEHLSDSFKTRDPSNLPNFHFNYRFVQFCMTLPSWPQAPELPALERKIHALREKIVLLNAPLAIDRAQRFYRLNSNSYLTLFDFLQIALGALINGVDKFCPPFNRMFRGVIIGRITGDLISFNSSYLLHYLPNDKRTYYNVNKVTRRMDSYNYDEIARRVTELSNGKIPTCGLEVAEFLAATSMVSLHTTVDEDDDEATEFQDSMSASVTTQPDYQVEKYSSLASLKEALSKLTPLERKILKLKGVSSEELL